MSQKLPFHSTMMSYIEANYSYNLYQKLVNTCKHFFTKKFIIPIDNISISDEATFLMHGNFNDFIVDDILVSINGQRPCKIWIKDLSISNFLNFPRFLLNIFSIENIVFYDQIIEYSHIQCLATKGRYKSVSFYDCQVRNSYDELIDIAYILKLFPDVTKASLYVSIF